MLHSTTPTPPDTSSQHVGLPPTAAYIHTSHVGSEIGDLLSARTTYIDATGVYMPMTVDMLRLMEYPPALDDPDEFTPRTTWTELASEEVEAGKYIIFDYILTSSDKTIAEKESEIDNLFEYFVTNWTDVDYQRFSDRIAELPSGTTEEVDFQKALQEYLDEHSGREISDIDE